ncbi:hypothetical protein [Sphingomonas sp.]|uniref:hypothetical protein n=1 Tax=Sphingomonas sp. TaxID=28214 RepID=UPI00286BA8F6|nr:hypothetical protein [Sphingomonas sp.]
MRTTFPLMIAIALTAATPAAAQGTDNTVNAAAVAAPASNDMAVATDNMAADPTMMSNDMGAAPAMDQPVEMATEPAPAKPSGFPWGVLGLLGLVGLMGRKRA